VTEPRGILTGRLAPPLVGVRPWAAEDPIVETQVTSRIGAVVGGRSTYEAADHWGDQNQWGLPFFIVTHRPEEEPPGGAFTFVSGVEAAVDRALQGAGGKDIHVMGGAELIREALEAGIVDELTIIVAPVIMGGGKRLFDGFTRSLDLEQLGVRQSAFATFIDYRIRPRE
jgi:dihydrofolate reductase